MSTLILPPGGRELLRTRSAKHLPLAWLAFGAQPERMYGIGDNDHFQHTLLLRFDEYHPGVYDWSCGRGLPFHMMCPQYPNNAPAVLLLIAEVAVYASPVVLHWLDDHRISRVDDAVKVLHGINVGTDGGPSNWNDTLNLRYQQGLREYMARTKRFKPNVIYGVFSKPPRATAVTTKRISEQ